MTATATATLAAHVLSETTTTRFIQFEFEMRRSNNCCALLLFTQQQQQKQSQQQ